MSTSFSYIPSDILGDIIKYVNPNDLPNIAATNKSLYKTTLLHYPFDNYKILAKLSDSDFNIVLKNVNVNSEVVFKAIILSNKYKILKTYINKIDPSIDDNWAVIEASKNGFTKIVKLLLLDKRVDPSHNYAIMKASENGHYDVVQALLKDDRVDPSADDNYAIRHASENGHYKIVRALLTLPKERGVDPSIRYNLIIREASMNGYYEIVKMLLGDRRIDPSYYNNNALKSSIRKGYYKIVKLLLSDKRVTIQNNKTILLALRYEHINIAELLLENYKTNKQQLLAEILDNEYYDFAKKIILSGYIVDHRDNILIAAEYGDIEIFKLLLKEDDIILRGGFLMKMANTYSNLEVIDYIADDNSIKLSLDPDLNLLDITISSFYY